MRFRTGLLVGLAVGYYYGTKAGHQRFLEIEEWLDRIRTTTTYQDARTKLGDGLREGSTFARRFLEDTAFGERMPVIGGRGVFVDPDPTDPMPFTVVDPTLN